MVTIEESAESLQSLQQKRMKMEKTPRYTQKERNMVLGYAAQHKDIIENKRTDAESNRKKDEVWRQIAKEFNARVYHQRSAKQLRQLYKNMKLLLKKDLCGEDKGNKTFMDLLITISNQESMSQYISALSPGGFSACGRLNKMDDDYDDMKMSSVGSYGHDMDTDVIVIKSEELSDNEHSRTMDDMDDDDDDCLSSKDIPEVCLEEEDEELFTDSRPNSNSNSHQPHLLSHHNLNHHHHQQHSNNNNNHLNHNSNSSQQNANGQDQKPEVTIQNVGNIRVANLANLSSKAAASNNSTTNGNGLLTLNNSNNNTHSNNNNHNNTNSLSNSNNNNNNSNSQSNNSNNNGGNSGSSLRQSSVEQAQQQMLLNGLGLSAVNPVNALVQRAQQNSRALSPQLAALQRANASNNNNNNSSSNNNNNNNSSGNNNSNSLAANANAVTQLLMNITNGANYAAKLNGLQISTNNNNNNTSSSSNNNSNSNNNNVSNSNGYLKNFSFNSSLNSSSSSSGSSNNNNNNTTANNNNNISSLLNNSSNFNLNSNSNSNNSDYLMFLEIEEKRRKIDLINAQTEYWKTLTKQLESQTSSAAAGPSHSHGGVMPGCSCQFSNALKGISTSSNGSPS